MNFDRGVFFCIVCCICLHTIWDNILFKIVVTKYSSAKLIFNSDAPFSPVQHSDPLIGIYAADTRRALNGGSFVEEKDQRLTRREAIESFTIHPAYAAFEENIKGSLQAGMLADIAVWSNDISQIPAKMLLNTEAVMTIIGGEVVYDKESLLQNQSN